jgi:prevent-host-death family protein
MGIATRRSISAADANRYFSKVLKRVSDGDSYVITNHGRPVARIVPFAIDDRVMDAAGATLFARLRTQRATRIGRWTRDELYEDA